MTNNPQKILENNPMTALQYIAVAMCILLNALDGFDVLSIAFGAPGITKEWGITRAALGVVLSMELIGMGVGSIILGGVADKYGRRPIILGSLVVISAGMFLAGTAHGVFDLSIYRLITGLGIGGMLSAISAMAAEYANARFKSMAVSFMAGGFPIGVIVGGIIAGQLLHVYTWRSVFFFGGAVTAVFFVLTWFLLPESVSYLVRQRPAGALDKINAIMRRMKHQTIDALPDVSLAAGKKKMNYASLFSPAMISVTVLLVIGYFMHIMTHYYFLKWVPKIVVDMGYAPSSAGGVLVWANVGGLIACFLLGILTRKISLRILTIIVLLGTTVMIIIFGSGATTLAELSTISAFAGAFSSAAVTGFYALLATSFPTSVRASGTGFVIGIGRAGATLGPITAGVLFTAGQSLQVVSIVMGCGSLIALIALIFLRAKTVQRAVEADAEINSSAA